MQSCDPIVGFNWFPAFATFARTVSFGPVVHKCLKSSQMTIGVQSIAIYIWKTFYFCSILLPEKFSLI
jgi:hypothetical protein